MLRWRPITLLLTNKQRPAAHATIKGRRCELQGIYVHVPESPALARVEYMELSGVALDDGSSVCERIPSCRLALKRPSRPGTMSGRRCMV